MKNREPMGPTGNCVCVGCGATVQHRPGVPCREQRCPKCGKAMVRAGSAHHAAAVEGRGGRARVVSAPEDKAAPRTAEERKRAFVERTGQYLRMGHDRRAAACLVAGAAGNLVGPALDVGTGKGLLAMALAARDLEVVSVDVNAEDSELAALLAAESGLKDRIRFLIQDASALPFPDGSFGCALMMDVLHHLDDAGEVLAEMARVVRPGGTIVTADFTEEGFAVVAAIHRGEGREHGRSTVTVEAAAGILTTSGWRAGGEKFGHLHHVRWFRKE